MRWLNNNIGCIETTLHLTMTQEQGALNNNIGCIETKNEKFFAYGNTVKQQHRMY